MELLWRDSLQCPTEEQYISMVNDSKREITISRRIAFLLIRLVSSAVILTETGGLFRVAVKLMMACATTNVNV